jgi:hypothetical protein
MAEALRAGVQIAAVKAAATIILDSFINLTSHDTAPAGARRGAISNPEYGGS